MAKRREDGKQLGRGTFRIRDGGGRLIAMVSTADDFYDPITVEYWAFTDHFDPPQSTSPQDWRIERVRTSGYAFDEFVSWARGQAAISGFKMSVMEWVPFALRRRVRRRTRARRK
jgi:hypothetical protein